MKVVEEEEDRDLFSVWIHFWSSGAPVDRAQVRPLPAAVTQVTSCCMAVSVGRFHVIIFSIVQITIICVINLLTFVLVSESVVLDKQSTLLRHPACLVSALKSSDVPPDRKLRSESMIQQQHLHSILVYWKDLNAENKPCNHNNQTQQWDTNFHCFCHLKPAWNSFFSCVVIMSFIKFLTSLLLYSELFSK